MAVKWNEFGFTVAMPHMVPGGKLSEVELFKVLGSFQWDAIGLLLGCASQDIRSDRGERLYSSFIDIELSFGAHHSPEHFSEGTRVYVYNRVQVFAQRFMEGLFLFSGAPITQEHLAEIHSLEDLRNQDLPWAYMTNAFIARVDGNTKLKVFKPAGIEGVEVDELVDTPKGIIDQRRALETGEIEDFGDSAIVSLTPSMLGEGERIPYRILPESDLNGAGLVYFARYPAMMNYAERIFLSQQMSPPLSTALISCLSCEQRRIYYFANASDNDSVEMFVEASVIPSESSDPSHGLPSGYRKMLEFLFRVDMFRMSDKTLMASSLVKKALHVPEEMSEVLMEVDRFAVKLPDSG